MITTEPRAMDISPLELWSDDFVDEPYAASDPESELKVSAYLHDIKTSADQRFLLGWLGARG
jgi:hypothetical protein